MKEEPSPRKTAPSKRAKASSRDTRGKKNDGTSTEQVQSGTTSSSVKSCDFRLSEELVKKLSLQVSFETEADLRCLIADALNTYLHLGTLRAQGLQFFAVDPMSKNMRRLRFSFETED